MTLDQIRAFISVVETGSFRAAAQKRFKTQSTISAAVQSLEKEFGISLFDRSQYRPVLTSEGKAFYLQARRLIEDSESLIELGHTLTGGTDQQLNIALSAMCAQYHGLSPIADLLSEHPDIRLNITTEHLSGIPEQLEKNNADLAIGPDVGLSQAFEYLPVFSVRLQCVAAPGYIREAENDSVPIHNPVQVQNPDTMPDNTTPDLPKRSDSICSHKVMRNYPHILIADSGREKPLDHVNVIPGGIKWYADDYGVKKALLLARCGWARMPVHMIEHELSQRLLVPLTVENFANQNEVMIYLIRKRDKTHSQLAEHLWDMFTGAR